MISLPPRLAKWAPQFAAAELCYGVPAGLMAAIVDRESLGGEALKPPGSGGTGDKGRGHGLAQIDIGYHKSFLVARFDSGNYLWADPTFNVLYGARLLSKNYQRTGSWPMAVAAYNAGLTRVREAVVGVDMSDRAALVRAVDSVTTGKDYVTDVFRRMADFGGAV